MSRLIDSDKLLDDMKKELEKAVNDKNLDKAACTVILTSAIALKDFVDRQPTAFDVDKVVEQLEELKEWEDVDGKAYYTMSEKQVINKAIKIVKRGGIND